MANDYGCFMEKMTLYLLMKTAIVISHRPLFEYEFSKKEKQIK